MALHPPPPQKQLPEHISAARIPTSLLATVLEARPFASFKGLTAASCIRIVSTVSNRHFRPTPSFFSSQGTSVLRWSAPPRMHGARNRPRTAHGGSTERRGHCSKNPTKPCRCPDRRRRRLHGPRDPDFQDSSRSHFSSFHPIHHLDLFSFLLALRNWLLDPIQPASKRALIGSSYPEPGLFHPATHCHPTLNGRGFRGVVAELGQKGKGGLDAGELGFGDFSSFQPFHHWHAPNPSLFFFFSSSFPLCLLLKHVLIPSYPACGATIARTEVPNPFFE